MSHGGPTANASTALDLQIQLLTSRGIAVVDVDYGGSTGYGRDYRRQLDGAWGVVDVDDCVAAARFLAERGDVDPDRLAIQGGSAGGYTTLAALAFRDTFAAGISLFGIGDLETLARDTHKFESRYTDRLVGPYPAMAERYRLRSPVHYLDEVSCPVLVLQGLEDKVVPPAQAEALVAALAANGIPHRLPCVRGRGPRLPRRGRPASHDGGPARLPGSGLRVRAGRRAGHGRCPASRPGGPAAPPPSPGDPPTCPGSTGPPDPHPMEHDPRPDRARAAAAHRGRGPVLPRPLAAHRRADPAGPRRRRPRVRPEPARARARARTGPGLPAVPAADPVRGRVLHADPRLPGQPPSDPAAGHRARAVHHGRRRGRGVGGDPGTRTGRRADPGRDRRPAGCGRRHRHLPAPGRPATDRHDPRGREPRSTTRRRSSPTASRRPSPSASSASRSSTRPSSSWSSASVASPWASSPA